MIRVELPFHLRTLAGVDREVTVSVADPVTIGGVLDAVETRYPVLRGTIRDHVTLARRPFLRFYACEEDFSSRPFDTRLPDDVVSGKEPFSIIGAIAGGSGTRRRHHDLGLLLIAILKLGYGFLLLTLGIGLLSLIHKDLTALVTHWADVLEINSENQLLQKLLEQVMLVRTNHLAWVSAITFFYSALSFAMGIGLWLEKRWAEYLTTLVTTSFIPFEIYEVVRHVRATTIIVITINVVIVIYLIGKLKKPRSRAEPPAQPS